VPEQRKDQDEVRVMIPGKALAGLVGAFLVAAGSWSTWEMHSLKTDPSARPDPWTGTQAREQNERLQRQINSLRVDYSKVESRVDQLEQCRATVYERLDRILGILNDYRDHHILESPTPFRPFGRAGEKP
jgi:hypothetical protein